MNAFRASLVLVAVLSGAARAQDKPVPPPPPPAAPAAGIDLSHLKVGQTFRYAIQGGVHMVWTITEIRGTTVHYSTQSLMDLGQGMQPVGDPTPSEFPHAAPVAPGGKPPATPPGMTIAREQVTIGKTTFDCMVTSTGDARTHIAMQGDLPVFPGLIKTTQNGAMVMELVEIGEGGATPAPGTTTPGTPGTTTPPGTPGTTPGAPGTTPPPAPAAVDLSHLEVGQRFWYVMQGGVQMTWTITEVRGTTVCFRVQALMDMGQGLQPVGDASPSEFPHAVPVAGGGAPMQVPGGGEVTREKLTIAGVEYDCLVTTTQGTKSWIAMQGDVPVFPGCVKSMQDGQTVMELTKVERPSH